MLQAAVKRLQNRSGEDISAKNGAVFQRTKPKCELEVRCLYSRFMKRLKFNSFALNFCINSDMDEWHYLTLLHYLDMADGTEGSQKLITFGNHIMKDGLIRVIVISADFIMIPAKITAEQKLSI